MSAITALHRTPAGDRTGIQQKRSIEVVVLFRDVPSTLQALRTAAKLARGLQAQIRLLVPQVVPYPLPLDQPVVQPSVTAQRYLTVAEQAEIGQAAAPKGTK